MDTSEKSDQENEGVGDNSRSSGRDVHLDNLLRCSSLEVGVKGAGPLRAGDPRPGAQCTGRETFITLRRHLIVESVLSLGGTAARALVQRDFKLSQGEAARVMSGTF